MTRKQLLTGVAVTASLVVVAVFFIFNTSSFSSSINQQAAAGAAAQRLVVQDEIIGTGETAVPGDLLTVHYTGKFTDGTVFDSSRGRAPFDFVLGAGQVIAGFDQGLVGMKVGGKRLLIIPPSLAYGTTGAGAIPPNSTLVFEVDLLKVGPTQ